MSSEKEILVQIERLKKYFPLRNSKKGAAVRAVDDVSLNIYKRDIYGNTSKKITNHTKHTVNCLSAASNGK